MSTNKQPCICTVINLPIVDENGNEKEPLLHLICSNSLSEILYFIFSVSDSLDVFTIQDDDGNTPFHLLGQRINLLEPNYFYDIDEISSEPSLNLVFKILKLLSDYIDFSIKNKEGKSFEEFHKNIIIENICLSQKIKKKNNKFPLERDNKRYVDNTPFVAEWNELFKLRDSNRKNRTLLHYLFMGDRLSAIKFLVDQGADVNYRRKTKSYYGEISYGPSALSVLFTKKYFTCTYVGNHSVIQNHISLRVPSGFNKIPEAKTGWSSDYNELLQPREKRILEETENIAKYLIECGSDITFDGEIIHCDISDVIYKAYCDKENKTETTSFIDKFKNLSKIISNTLMDCPCLPFGNFNRNIYNDIEKVKYVKLESCNKLDLRKI